MSENFLKTVTFQFIDTCAVVGQIPPRIIHPVPFFRAVHMFIICILRIIQARILLFASSSFIRPIPRHLCTFYIIISSTGNM